MSFNIINETAHMNLQKFSLYIFHFKAHIEMGWDFGAIFDTQYSTLAWFINK